MLETIYVVRHGYRSNWAVDPSTGQYSSAVRTPTGIPSDPALASYGVLQAEQLGTHLLNIQPQPDKIYSSPYYRCLQTLLPYVTKRAERDGSVEVWVEKGLGEFYGSARFQHPSPAELDVLSEHFDHLKAEEQPVVVPSRNGESIEGLHERMAYCLSHLIARADADPNGPKTILLCSHAAAIIAIGRVLTGRMPDDVSEEDFSCYTCGVSTFTRRPGAQTSSPAALAKYGTWDASSPSTVPDVDWKEGKGVAGGWECEKNSDCSFLENGEERGWNFWMEAKRIEEEERKAAAAPGADEVEHDMESQTTTPVIVRNSDVQATRVRVPALKSAAQKPAEPRLMMAVDYGTNIPVVYRKVRDKTADESDSDAEVDGEAEKLATGDTTGATDLETAYMLFIIVFVLISFYFFA